MATDSGYGELVPLGEGPVATVYAGMRAETGEAVALKVFPETTLPKRTRTELDRELARLAPLRTEAPILVADAVEELAGGRLALRMELCSQSLAELITSFGPLSVADALALGQAMATALESAHQAGIVHGGVSPGNVLFRPSGEPLLSDFGLTLRRAFPRDSIRGVDYLAPETLRDSSADERSDLYGLGAILYLALSGDSPHPGIAGEQHDEQVLRVLSSPIAPLARTDLPDGLADLVSALLAKDPDARMADVAAFAARLGAMAAPAAPWSTVDADPVEEFEDFAGTPAPQSPRPQGEPLIVSAPRKPDRTGTLGLALGGGGIVVVLIAAAVLLLQDDPAVLDVSPGPVPATMAAPSTPTSTQRAVQLELADPVDRGNFVELAWTSSEPLEFAVAVASEDEQTKTVLAQRNRTLTIAVDPLRKYCFEVRATNGPQVWVSQPKPIRGAVCKK